MNRLNCLLLCCVLQAAACRAAAQPILYPAPAGLSASADYRVFINGKEAFVYASPVPAAYCSFGMNGPVDILIKAARDIKWADIRPLKAGIRPLFKDSTIHFRLNAPAQLSVELNGSSKLPLFIFANAPEKNKPSRNDKDVLFFEAGKIHHAGIIRVNSGQTVYIEAGAVVTGVIKAVGAAGIRIAGRGVLDGTYNNRFNDELIKSGAFSKLPAASDSNYQRSIELINCSNVTVEGITLHNSTSWQLVPVNSNNIQIRNIKIVSDQPSDDGIDIVHCKNVLVSHCFIRTKDDCIAVKAYFNKDKGPVYDSALISGPDSYQKYTVHPVQDVDSILVQNAVFWNAMWGNGLEIGFELNGAAVKNITFRNNDIIHVESGAVLSIHNAGNSVVSNIVFDDIRIEDARQKLFDFAVFCSRYSEDGENSRYASTLQKLNGAWDGVLKVPPEALPLHAAYRGHISNIILRNISVYGHFPFSIFYGYDDTHLVNGVKIDNLRVNGKRISSLHGARFYMERAKKIYLQ